MPSTQRVSLWSAQIFNQLNNERMTQSTSASTHYACSSLWCYHCVRVCSELTINEELGQFRQVLVTTNMNAIVNGTMELVIRWTRCGPQPAKLVLAVQYLISAFRALNAKFSSGRDILWARIRWPLIRELAIKRCSTWYLSTYPNHFSTDSLPINVLRSAKFICGIRKSRKTSLCAIEIHPFPNC